MKSISENKMGKLLLYTHNLNDNTEGNVTAQARKY